MKSNASLALKKSILITGVSSGIGAGMARKFLQQGFRVFGSVRSKEKAEQARSLFGEGFYPLVFDICNEEQVIAARNLVEQELNGQQLAAIINNAGMAEIGPLLHVSPESFRHQLDVLVVGQLVVIQSFHGLLSTEKATPGKIYNISSISGEGVNPYFGCYAAGKHGIEGLSKTLRSELERYGTQVVVIAPANIVTEIWPKQTAKLIEQYRNTDYYDALDWLTERFSSKKANDAMSVEEFCEAMYEIYCTPNPAFRYTVYKGHWGPSLINKLTKNRVRISQK